MARHAYITTYTVLTAYDEDLNMLAEETDGTTDAVTDIDYTVSRCEARQYDESRVTETYMGDDVSLWCTLLNSSYVLPDIASYPSAYVTWTVTCPDGTELVRSAHIRFDSVDPIVNAPCSSFDAFFPETVMLEQAGTYTVSCRIDGLACLDADGTETAVTEAYTANNDVAVFTLNATEESLLDMDVYDGEQPAELSADIYYAVVSASQGTDYTLPLPGLDDDGLTLIDRTGEPVTGTDCAFNGDGMLCLTLSADWANALDEIGETPAFRLQDADGTTVAWVELELM